MFERDHQRHRAIITAARMKLPERTKRELGQFFEDVFNDFLI
jgi:hypothetical protein